MADPNQGVPPEPSQETSSSSPLNFDEALPVDGAVPQKSCSICGVSPLDMYYVASGDVVCSDCAQEIAQKKPPEPGISGLGRALLYGSGAALLGTILYYAVLALTGVEIGFLAVIVGWLVGRAVRKGGRECGGWKLQTMAVALTYCSIIGSYVPLVIKAAAQQMEKKQSSAKDVSKGAQAAQVDTAKKAAPPPPITAVGLLAGLLIFAALMLAMPFLAGLENILGLFIIGLGLWEAWRINRKPVLMPAGPFFAKAAETQ